MDLKTHNEIVAANIAVTKLAQTLDKLVSDMQSLNAGNALQQSYVFAAPSWTYQMRYDQ